MGEPGGGAQPEAAALQALKKKLEELEALGVPTEGLRKTLAERPEDFEREAEEALRREIHGGVEPEATPPETRRALPATPSQDSEPGSPAGPKGTEEPSSHTPAAGPESPMGETARPEAPQPLVGGAGLLRAIPAPTGMAPEAPSPEDVDQPALPIPDEADLAALEATVAALVGEPAAGPRHPQVIESPPEAPEAVEADLAGELEKALEAAPSAQAPAPDGPPVLSGGDSFSLAPRPANLAEPESPATASQGAMATPGAKPPPPSARTSATTRPVTKVRVGPPPEGAKPAPSVASTPGATEVLPTTEARRRYLAPLLAAVLLLGLFAGTYLLLVNGPPSVAFSISPSSAVAGDLVFFSANNTTDPNGDPVSFVWLFGDGANATGRTAFHTYAHSGDFTVTVRATDDHGNAAPLSRALPVAEGTVVPPAYRYGDSLQYTAHGDSHIEGSPAHTPLATVNFTVVGQEQSCNIEAVDLQYDGPQTRSVLSTPQTVADGFLTNRPTYALERSLPALVLHGQVNTTCQNAPFQGSSTLLERAFLNPQNNDTIRSETDETTEVRVATEPPTDLSSQAHVTQFSRLAKASEQLHLEPVYALRAFSTEGVNNGTFVAEGLTWSWLTQGTQVIRGHLTVKVHLQTSQAPRLSRLTIDLWVSSASPFPLQEVVFVRLIDIGRITQSTFSATASAEPTPGLDAIPYGDGTRSYPPVSASELAPLGEVPRSSLSADFALTARSAFNQSMNSSVDFANFMAANPTAYAVNGTYTRSGGNPKWMLEFSFASTGETKRCEVEQSTATQVRCTGGSTNAAVPRSAIGSVVSLNFAADLMKREPTALQVFPSSAFDAAHANFTIQRDLRVPALSLNAAGSASQEAVPYAFGVESYASQTTRITAAVDAQGGQLLFVLRESGDRLP